MLTDQLRVLTAEERTILSLRLGQRLTVDQIAAQLGKSPHEVRAITRAGLRRLQRADAQTTPGFDRALRGAAGRLRLMTSERTRLESLPPDERAALSWHVQSGQSVRQIAERMKRSPEDVVLLILRGSRTLFGTRTWGDQAGAPDRDELPSY